MGKKKKKKNKKKKLKTKCNICLQKFKFKSTKKATKKGWFCDPKGDECKKWYCKDCVRDYFIICGQFLRCIRCDWTIKIKDLIKYIETKDLKIFEEHKSIKLIRSMEDIVPCPGIDCPMYYWRDHLCQKGECIECKIKWCILCNYEWTEEHKDGMKCVGRFAIPYFKSKEKIQYCPFCKAQTVKISGCRRSPNSRQSRRQVNCKNCGKNYCFVCKNKRKCICYV